MLMALFALIGHSKFDFFEFCQGGFVVEEISVARRGI
jgi:hypothetical protein